MADLPVPALPADEVRSIADEVLARAEFAEAQPTWWQRAVRWVYDLIGRALEALGGDGRGSVIATVTIVVVALVILAVVLRYAGSLRSDPRRSAVTDEALGRTVEAWLAEAEAAETAQRWRDAVRCRYRALLADLAAAGLVEEIAGRTSGEYLAAVTADVPGAAAAFTQATRRFEAAWYGHATTSADDVGAFRAAATRTLGDAGLRRSAVPA